ncbi:MAG: hypothetical protein WDN07_02975 [Actinomycetota bacterium]
MWPTITLAWRRKRWLAVMAIVFVASTILTGCSMGGSVSNTKALTADPGKIAVTFTVDLYSSKLSAARELVYSLDRPPFDILAAVIRGNRTSARDVSVGSSTINGNTAIVILEGTFCVAGPAGTASGAKAYGVPKCFTNSNPKSSNLAARVKLIRVATGRWYVYFPRPKVG